jgi:hypothetical protein
VQECTRDYSLCQTRGCGKSKPFLDSSPDVSSFHESSGMSENIIKIIFSDIILYDLWILMEGNWEIELFSKSIVIIEKDIPDNNKKELQGKNP